MFHTLPYTQTISTAAPLFCYNRSIFHKNRKARNQLQIGWNSFVQFIITQAPLLPNFSLQLWFTMKPYIISICHTRCYKLIQQHTSICHPNSAGILVPKSPKTDMLGSCEPRVAASTDILFCCNSC